MRLPRFLAVVLAVGVVSTTAVVAVSPADARRAAREPSSITITGRGYGHGHGLSAWGSEEAAQQGLTPTQILDFYYPGTHSDHAGGKISVLISADSTTDVVVSARPGLEVTGLGDHQTYALSSPGATAYRLLPVDGARSTAVSYQQAGRRGWTPVRTVPGQAQFSAGRAPLSLRLPSGASVAYRGVLRSAAPAASSRERDTVNVVPLDSYVKGVMPREFYPSWEPAALQAEAVAVRTFAAYERAHPRTGYYQVCDTSSCQVYGGHSAEFDSTNAAVAATRQQILTTDDGSPALTMFSASNGGWTVDGGEPYLIAEPDPYDTHYRDWTTSVSAAAVERAFPGIGTFTGAGVVARDGHGQWGGRAVTVRLTGTKGSTRISGDTFRSTFGLRSTWFTLS